MFEHGAVVVAVGVGPGVGAAFVAHEQRVALREVARVDSALVDFHQSAVAVLAVAGRDTLADDGAAGALADMDHLGAGVGLLVVVGDGHGVELAYRVVALQHAAGVLPGDGRAGFHLRPRYFGAVAFAEAAFGDEVVDAAFAVLIARVPVLYGGVFHLRIFEGHNFHNSRMKLIFITLRSGTAFQIAHVRTFVGHDEGALELSGVFGVDTEIGAEVDGAAHALGDITEGAFAEDGRVQGCEEVVAGGHHAAEVLLHQVGVALHGLAERAEQDALLLQHVGVHGLHRDGVDDGIHGHHRFLLFLLLLGLREGVGVFIERDAELVESFHHLRHLVFLGDGKIYNILVVRFFVMKMCPVGFGHGLPFAEGLEAELEQPLGFFLPFGDHSDDIFIKPFGKFLHLDAGDKSVLILLCIDVFNDVFFHSFALKNASCKIT